MAEYKLALTTGEPTGDTDPERMLACAVLERAIMDADPRAYATNTGDSNATRMHERDKALQFLTAEAGIWAQQRNFWVNLAGLDPDAFREGINKRFAKPRAPRKTGQRGMQPL